MTLRAFLTAVFLVWVVLPTMALAAFAAACALHDAREARRRATWRLDAPPYEPLRLVVPRQTTAARPRPRLVAVPRQPHRTRP